MGDLCESRGEMESDIDKTIRLLNTIQAIRECCTLDTRDVFKVWYCFDKGLLTRIEAYELWDELVLASEATFSEVEALKNRC